MAELRGQLGTRQPVSFTAYFVYSISRVDIEIKLIRATCVHTNMPVLYEVPGQEEDFVIRER